MLDSWVTYKEYLVMASMSAHACQHQKHVAAVLNLFKTHSSSCSCNAQPALHVAQMLRCQSPSNTASDMRLLVVNPIQAQSNPQTGATHLLSFCILSNCFLRLFGSQICPTCFLIAGSSRVSLQCNRNSNWYHL